MASAPTSIFISHASADKDLARTLADQLRTEGFDTWLDERELRFGQSWRDEISRRLDSSDAFVLIVSEASQQSPWVRRETSEILKRAWADNTKIIVPIIVGSAEPPGFLRDHLALHLTGTSEVEKLLHWFSAQSVPGGVSRSEAGDARLESRLAELQDTAASLASTQDEDG